MKSFFEAIKKFVSQNYWVQPLLLVLMVFVLVFGLQLVPSVFSTIQGWFTPEAKCTECNKITFDQAEDYLDGEDEVIILITAPSCSACISFYPVVNRYLDAHPEITIYQIDIGKNTQGDYNDSTLSDAAFERFFQAVDSALIRLDEASIYNTGLGVYSPGTPTLIKGSNYYVSDVEVGSLSYTDLVNWIGA
jgi:thiol-disulfide isomerase/thioredoxin